MYVCVYIHIYTVKYTYGCTYIFIYVYIVKYMYTCASYMLAGSGWCIWKWGIFRKISQPCLATTRSDVQNYLHEMHGTEWIVKQRSEETEIGNINNSADSNRPTKCARRHSEKQFFGVKTCSKKRSTKFWSMHPHSTLGPKTRRVASVYFTTSSM